MRTTIGIALVLFVHVSSASAQVSYSACMSEAAPGMSTDRQAKLCESFALKKQRSAWAERIRARDVLGQESDVRQETPVTIDPDRLRNDFNGDRKSLLANLQPWATALKEAREFAVFENSATAVRAFIGSFQSKYSWVQRYPEVDDFLGRLNNVDFVLRQAVGDWRGETANAARVEYLIAQQSEPLLTRDGYAHPSVVEWNLKKTRDAQVHFARSREETVPAARKALAALTKE